MKPSKNYTTHISTLLVAIRATRGKVIELGGGQSSTPFLHWVCKAGNKKLITYENHPAFYKYLRQFQSYDHRVRKVEDWNKVPIEKCGVLFVDLHPAEMRHEMAIKFKDAASIVVVHDTEREDKYQNSKIGKHFKYSYTYKDATPWTTMFSNHIDVTEFGDKYKLICY